MEGFDDLSSDDGYQIGENRGNGSLGSRTKLIRLDGGVQSSEPDNLENAPSFIRGTSLRSVDQVRRFRAHLDCFRFGTFPANAALT